MFLEISQNSQESNCASLFFGLQLYLKRDSGTGVSCEFRQTSMNTFFIEHLWWLLLLLLLQKYACVNFIQISINFKFSFKAALLLWCSRLNLIPSITSSEHVKSNSNFHFAKITLCWLYQSIRKAGRREYKKVSFHSFSKQSCI